MNCSAMTERSERMHKDAFQIQAPRLNAKKRRSYIERQKACLDSDGRIWIHASDLDACDKSPFTDQSNVSLWYSYWQDHGSYTNIAPPTNDIVRLRDIPYRILRSLIVPTSRRKYGAFELG